MIINWQPIVNGIWRYIYKRNKLKTLRVDTGPFFHSSLLKHVISFVFSAVKKFLLNKLSLGDVWMVGIRQAIEWIKTPTSLDDIENFAPWKCDSPPPPPSCDSPNVCSFRDNPNYLWTCTRPCPPHYPWVGNPDGNWVFIDYTVNLFLFLSCPFVSKTKAIMKGNENLQNEISPLLCFVVQLNSEKGLVC